MFVLSSRHTPLAAAGTLLTLLILLLTGTPTTSKGLICIHCLNLADCFNTYGKLGKLIQDYPVKQQPCNSPAEVCALHFTNYSNATVVAGKATLTLSGAMFIDQAGCAEPKKDHPKLDGAGCWSTPKTPTAPATRTCYCNVPDPVGCNHNILNCYRCKNADKCNPEIYPEKSSPRANECHISWRNTKRKFQNSVVFGDENQPKTTPNSCNATKNEEWDIYDRCTCQANLCNVVPQGLKDYLARNYPQDCVKCKLDNSYDPPSCRDEEYRCRPGSMCSAHYILKQGVYSLIELGCDTPPTSLNNGWDPPSLSSTDTKRSFYCEGHNCNHPLLQCVTCQGRACGDSETRPETCIEGLLEWNWDSRLPGRTKECFIRYDETVTPPQLEAGCRDFTLDKGLAMVDPICSRDLQGKWIGSKGSCRCEIPGCNPVLDKLAARIPEVENNVEGAGSFFNPKKSGGGISKFKAPGWGGFMMVFAQFLGFLEIGW